MALDNFYTDALRRMKDHWSETYEAIGADFLYLSGGRNMWDKDVYNARNGSRPIMSIPLIQPYIDTVVSPARLTPPNIACKTQDKKVQELTNGVIRAIEGASNSYEVYTGALSQATSGGLGWIFLEVVDVAGLGELRLRKSYDPTSIMLDPLSTEIDGSDARYAVYRGETGKAEAVAEYGEEVNQTPVGEGYHSFYATDDDCVMECIWWRLEKEGLRINKTIGGKEVFDVMYPGVNKLPVGPVYGEQCYGSERLAQGLVNRAKELNSAVNLTVSNVMELVALAPKQPYIGAADGFEPYKNVWANSNNENYAYLPFKHIDKNGNALPMPQRADNTAQTQGLQGVADWLMAIQTKAMGINDVQMGGIATAMESGKSVIARMEAAAAGTQSLYLDHLTCTITQVGKALIQLIPHVYKGHRAVCIIDSLGNSSELIGDITEILTPEVVKYLDVEIQSGPQLESKRKAAAEALSSMITTAGADKGILLLDLWVDTQNLPNQDEVKARVQKMLPVEFTQNENTEEDPAAVAALEEASAIIDQKDQTIQYMEQALTKLQQQLQGQEALAMAELRKAEISAQTTLTKAQMDNASKKEIELLKLGSEDARTAAKLSLEQSKYIQELIAKMEIENAKMLQNSAENKLDFIVDREPTVPQYVQDDLAKTESNMNEMNKRENE